MDPDAQLKKLRKQEKKITSSLLASRTAYGGEQRATRGDLRKQIRLENLKEQIRIAENKKIQQKWYGPKKQAKSEREGGQRGVVGKVLDTFSQPLYAVTGALEYTLGRGQGASLAESIDKNRRISKRTFGDILRSKGTPGVVAAPLGFALDIAFDPLNWVTAGTAALIPRVALGVKGGARGVSLGIKSGFLQKAATVGRAAEAVLPGYRKSKIARNLSGAAYRAFAEYDAAIGRDFVKNIPRAGIVISPSGERATLGDLVEKVSEKNPFLKKVYEQFNYSNKEWTKLTLLKDQLIKNLGYDLDVKAMRDAYKRGVPLETLLDEAARGFEKYIKAIPSGEPRISNIDWGAVPDVPINDDVIDEAVQRLKQTRQGRELIARSSSVVGSVDDAVSINKNPKISHSFNADEGAQRIAAEHEIDGDVTAVFQKIKQLVDEGALGDTGVRWYDNLEKRVAGLKKTVRVRNKEIELSGKKALEGYKAFINMFKRSKVGASLTGWTNAILGNPIMAKMMGINIFSDKYIRRVNQARKLIYGKKGADFALRDLFGSPEMVRLLNENPSLFRQTSGISPEFVRMRYKIDQILEQGEKAGLLPANISKEEAAKDVVRAIDEIINESNLPKGITDEMRKASRKMRRPSAVGQYRKQLMALGGEVNPGDFPTSFVSNELIDSKLVNRILKKLEDKVASGEATIGHKLLDLTFNKLSNAYEGIDQSFKLGTMTYATVDGLTEAELNMVRRFVDIKPEDILSKTPLNDRGMRRYRIDPAKAAEIANEIYLNYGAMPGAIKVFRTFPILGSPFASFMYGMALKTANTAVYNPSVFNKISFALNEFGGDKSPLEKEALRGQYYSYLNDPGMFRIPGSGGFFNKYPLYLNLSNAIPYYSFNIFNPSERRYDGVLPNTVVQLKDKIGLFNDPVGATIFDYFIQPMILQDAKALGSFGQPLAPYGSSFKQTLPYAARSLADSMMPGIWQTAAGVPTGMLLPKYVDFFPGYHWRKIANAVQGKNAYGKTSKESSGSRTIRALGSSAGISVQAPVNLTYLTRELKKNIKR